MPVRNQFDNENDFQRALRDWFAGQALSGLLARNYGSLQSPMGFANLAKDATTLADFMLRAREKGNDYE